MSRKNEHLLNVTDNCHRSRGQVIPHIGKTLAWVEEDVSYRRLSFAECMKARAMAEIASDFPPIEVSGHRFVNPAKPKPLSLSFEGTRWYCPWSPAQAARKFYYQHAGGD